MRSEKRKSVFQVFLQRASTPPGDLELVLGAGLRHGLSPPASGANKPVIASEKILLFISGFLPPAGMCRGPLLVCLPAGTSALFFPNSRVSATAAVCLLDRFLQSGRPSSGDR